MKTLLFDIETSPASSYIWSLWTEPRNAELMITDWYILCWSAKWLDSKNIMTAALPDYKKEYKANKEDDYRVVLELWNLLDEADVVIAHNACVEKNTPILMQDLTWKPACKLIIGDKIVGFEEKNKPGTTRRDNKGKWLGKGERKVVSSKVTNIQIEKRFCMEVEFDNGDKVVTTPDHYWLGMSENCRNQQWYRTDKLKVGQKVNKFLTPWKENKTYEAGWLSGFISGEGTLKGNGASIDFCQRKTVVLDTAIKICKELGIKISEPKIKKSGFGRGDTLYSYTLGGKWKTLETLGKLQINRLIENINWNKFGSLKSTLGNDTTRTIVSIKKIGIEEIAVIETSSATYIANGYPMHNCKFDVRKVNSRFLVHGITPPSPYKVIDTLKVARQRFGFLSNKLTDLCKVLNIGKKLDTGGFQLWRDCIAGNKSAWKKMVSYCKYDVILLEKLYKTIRPFIYNHPNAGSYSDTEKVICGACGSDRIHYRGFYHTNISRYKRFVCRKCGKWGRLRTTEKISQGTNAI